MVIDIIMQKYSMSIDDVLNVQAVYGGTVTIAAVLSDMDAENRRIGTTQRQNHRHQTRHDAAAPHGQSAVIEIRPVGGNSDSRLQIGRDSEIAPTKKETHCSFEIRINYGYNIYR